MSEATCGNQTKEPRISRSSSGLRLPDRRITSGKSLAAFAARSPHERSDMRELNKEPRISLRSSGLRLPDGRVTSGKSPAPFAARSPHERSDMRELNKRTLDIAELIRAAPAGQANNISQITCGVCCA